MLSNWFWNTNTLDLLRQCIVDKLSASQTAAKLSGILGTTLSRNACIGRAARMGLKFQSFVPGPKSFGHSPKSKIHKFVRNLSPRPSRFVMQPLKHRKSESLAPTPIPDGIGLDADIPMEQRRSLMDLREKDCRWPVGDPRAEGFFFCGAPAEWGPYCGHHAQRSQTHLLARTS